ncbi:LysE family translocator [Pleurocapsales cyanobacterium LEGE 06147]|nr:LysE family translocator [Pleurocapsales cyanobacterium LEGE 06147]
MESNLTFSSIAALFGAMVVLASIPSVSVLTVLARSTTSGFIHGAFTSIGIVVGDIVFIIIAICGLSVLAETMGSFFVLVKYLGGTYLIWLGTALWRSKSNSVEIEGVIESSLVSSFLTGLFITLGDLKAILFYLGFFPAFLDLSTVSILDTSIIIVVALVAVGGIKLGYAFIADRTSLLFDRSRTKKIINITAGSVMIGVGVFLIVKA